MGDRPIVVVQQDGDVLLKPGNSLSPISITTVSLRVSSQAMGLASPVFAAMFNGRFSEGENLSSASPKEFDLPDDNQTFVT
jgi:hypothetical protein